MPKPSHSLYPIKILIVTILIGSLVTVSILCTKPEVEITEGLQDNQFAVDTVGIGEQSVNAKRYEINRLSYEDLPQGYTSTVIPLEQLDKIQGLPIVHIQGEEGYHPVQTSWLLMELLSSYLITQDSAYLEKAFHISDMFLDTAVSFGEALYFPYTFDFHLHGDEEELMKAPWYSGMAQGIALSAYVRFYQITEDGKYLDICRKIFNTFTNLKDDENIPWVVYVDTERYYWIEEYPIQPPANTLNGFIYGIFGLYEYYLLVCDAETEAVLQSAITTIEHYMSQFRREGDISLYCLKHEVPSPKYHRIHMEQLSSLYSITGDRFFMDTTNGLMLDTIVVLICFKSGWLETIMAFLPSSVRLRIYSFYHNYQQIRQAQALVAEKIPDELMRSSIILGRT